MKFVLILLLSAPMLLAQESVLPRLGEEKITIREKKAIAKDWINFHEAVLRYKSTFRKVTAAKTKENEASFIEAGKLVEQSLNKLVESKELELGALEFTPKKLTKEQLNLLEYCFISVEQIYGKTATQEMFGMGLKMRYELKKQPDSFQVKTRLPQRFRLMLKRVIANDDLQNIKLPRPVDVMTMKEEKDLWVFLFRSLDLTDDLLDKIEKKIHIDPIEAVEAISSLYKVFNQLVKQKILYTKTYPFSIDQLSENDRKAYLSMVPNITGFSASTARELLGVGTHYELKKQLAEKPNQEVNKTVKDALNTNLTIHLPKTEFDQVTEFLDNVNIPTPTTQ